MSFQEAHEDEEDEVLSVDDDEVLDARTVNRWEEVEEVWVLEGGGFHGGFHGRFYGKTIGKP